MGGVSFKNLNTTQLNPTYAAFIKNDTASKSQDSPKSNKPHITKKEVEITGGLLTLGVLFLAFYGRTSSVFDVLTKTKQNITEELKESNSIFKSISLRLREFALGTANVYFNLEQKVKFVVVKQLRKFAPTKYIIEKVNKVFETIAITAEKQIYKHQQQELKALERYLAQTYPHETEIKKEHEKLKKVIEGFISEFEKTRLTKLKHNVEKIGKDYASTPFELKRLTSIISRDIANEQQDYSEQLLHTKDARRLLDKIEELVIQKHKHSGENIQNILASIKKSRKLLDEAGNFENGELRNTLIDIKLGTKVFDIPMLSVPFFWLGYTIHKSKTKDEKISAAIKYGAPITGGVSACLFAISRCINGPTAILFALASGTAFDYAGKHLSKKYMEIKKNKELQNY